MIVVCLKWVDQRPEVDGSGHPGAPDVRFAGVSAADKAALEWALRCRDDWPGQSVHAISAGPAGADAVLRDALAAGADTATRIDTAFDTDSRSVARLIAAHAADADFVLCGDYSFDRGTGSVPAFIAANLGWAQALGLVSLDIGGPEKRSGHFEALRRVDGGRRDRLAISSPAVLSVEGSTATLRRAPLRSMLGERTILVVTPPVMRAAQPPGVSRPFRPRARVLAGPTAATALDRVKQLTASGAAVVVGDPVTLDPDAAADRIIAALAEWNMLPQSHDE